MRPVQHTSSNDVLRPPDGATVDECVPLPITRVHFKHEETGETDGFGVASFWQPDAAELRLLNEGRAVRLCAWGRTHAPVSIGVDGDGVML